MRKLKSSVKVTLISAVSVAAVGTAVILVRALDRSNHVMVDSFIGQTKADVDAWIEENNISEDQIIYAYAYDEEEKIDTVLEQSIASGETLTQSDTLEITLSDGPDPNMEFELPDFTDKYDEEVTAWFADNKFTQVEFIYETNEEFEDKEFISMDPEAGTTVTRETKVKVTINMLEEGAEIEVPNLMTMSKEEIQAWGNENKITIVFETETSDTVARNSIISVSAKTGETVKQGSRITVMISSGNGNEVRTESSRKDETNTAAYATEETRNSTVSSNPTSKTDVSNNKGAESENTNSNSNSNSNNSNGNNSNSNGSNSTPTPTTTPEVTPVPTQEAEPEVPEDPAPTTVTYGMVEKIALEVISNSNSHSAAAIESSIRSYLANQGFTNVSFVYVSAKNDSSGKNQFLESSIYGDSVDISTPITIYIADITI